MFFRFLTILFILVILYRLLTRYILPIFRITAVASDRIRQMQDQMKQMDNRANNSAPVNNAKKEGDYIDYEEVR